MAISKRICVNKSIRTLGMLLRPVFLFMQRRLRLSHDVDFSCFRKYLRHIHSDLVISIPAAQSPLHKPYTGPQISNRLRWGGYRSKFRSILCFSRWSCVWSCRRFCEFRLRLIDRFTGRLRLRSFFLLSVSRNDTLFISTPPFLMWNEHPVSRCGRRLSARFHSYLVLWTAFSPAQVQRWNCRWTYQSSSAILIPL